MVYFEKSQPAPACLAIEKRKKSGDYKCGDVLDRLQADFKNKYYICETKAPTTINVEHFIAHKGAIDLKFDWDNLFWSCAHCNNTKLDKYNNLLNCTIITDNVERRLKYIMRPFPFEKVKIEALDSDPKTLNTQKILLEVYNGTTHLKTIEFANIRDNILKEISIFRQLLIDYFNNANLPEDIDFFLRKIRQSLSKSSNFTAFKRWIILDNSRLKSEFERYFD